MLKTALLALATLANARPDEGYLFVTNRGDEAVFAAQSVRRADPTANITFVSDAATLRDARAGAERRAQPWTRQPQVGAAKSVFDVVIRAEAAMPDLDVHDSMGFRLQKLRGALVRSGVPRRASAGGLGIRTRCLRR